MLSHQSNPELLAYAVLLAAEFNTYSRKNVKVQVRPSELRRVIHSRPLTAEEFITYAKQEGFYWNPLSATVNSQALGHIPRILHQIFIDSIIDDQNVGALWSSAVLELRKIPGFENASLRLAAMKVLHLYGGETVVLWDTPHLNALRIPGPLTSPDQVTQFFASVRALEERIFPLVGKLLPLVAEMLSCKVGVTKRMILDKWLYLEGQRTESHRNRILSDLSKAPLAAEWIRQATAVLSVDAGR